MKRIKFRAKGIKDGKYIYSNSIKFENIDLPQLYLYDKNSGHFIRCIPETLQQFTGMYDYDGVEIYEGDIIRNISFPELKFEVDWYRGCWITKSTYAEIVEDEFEILYEALRNFKFNVILTEEK